VFIVLIRKSSARPQNVPVLHYALPNCSHHLISSVSPCKPSMASRHRHPCQCRPKFIALYKLPALPGAAIPEFIVLIRKSSALAQYVPVLHKPLPNCSTQLTGKSLQAIPGLAAQASLPVPPKVHRVDQAPCPSRHCYPCASMQSRFGLSALKRCAFRTII
jgi:hypothetical protein